jgi:hypothetical protein
MGIFLELPPISLLFLKNGKNFGLNPGKSGLHALILIKFADLRLD